MVKLRLQQFFFEHLLHLYSNVLESINIDWHALAVINRSVHRQGIGANCNIVTLIYLCIDLHTNEFEILVHVIEIVMFYLL